MTVREALNSALDEEMSADPKVFLMGEEVRKCSTGTTLNNPNLGCSFCFYGKAYAFFFSF